MAQYSTNEFRSGLKVMLDGEPCNIVENEFVKPGKGQAFNRVKLRNFKTGRIWERTFKSGESIEAADVMEVDMQFLYSDDDFWHFMDPNTFEQISANSESVGEAKQWISPEDNCTVTLFNNNPITVVAPNFVELEIIETDPGIRGDTASGGTKPAKLVTGATVNVPLFVNQGETIKVDTRTKDYVSRVKQ